MTPLLCSGLAVFGLCLPVPGHSLQALIDSGWHVQEEEGEHTAVSSMSSGLFRMAVTVKFVDGVVASVLLLDTSKELLDVKPRPIDSALASACKRQNGKESCTVSGLVFERLPCAGGWLLARSIDLDRARIEARCKKWGKLFEESRPK